MELRFPDAVCLPSYVAALRRGYRRETAGAGNAEQILAAINADPAAYLRSLVDLDASGSPIELPDGSTAERIPGYQKWIWDGEFCGRIGLRWVPGGGEYLPAHVLGHIGYDIVPWKQRQGYASRALQMILPEARERGLRYVEVTTDDDNVASQKVILAAGGILQERFTMPEWYGGGPGRRYRIALSQRN